MENSEQPERLSLPELMRFLSTPEHRVTQQEFTEFWKSCTDEEREEFRRTKIH